MYRITSNSNGTIGCEAVADDMVASPGEVLLDDLPTAEEAAALFPEAAAAALAAERERAKTVVSALAETARLQFITPGSGKAMSYIEKASQARDFLAEDGIEHLADIADYPLIQAEIGITAETASGVAQVIVARYQAFRQIEAVISRAEAMAKQAIGEAADAAAIAAILAGLSWPAP